MRMAAILLVGLLLATAWAESPREPVGSHPDATGLRVAATARPAERAGERPSPTPEQASLTSLNLEVSALETLAPLHLNAAQLTTLQQLACGAADREDRRPGHGPEELRRSLLTIRDALLHDRAAEAARLQERVSDLLDGDDVDLDDAVELTAAARRRLPQALQLLSDSQVAAYLKRLAEDVEDPLEELLDALAESRTADQETFEELRDEVAEDVAFALSGLNTAKEREINRAVTGWLNQVRALSAREFRQQRSTLEQGARTFVGRVDRQQLLRSHLEYDVAELLSNPRLSAAIDGLRTALPRP